MLVAKRGFGLPMRDWMLGALSDFVRAGTAAALAVLPENFVRRVENDFQRGQLHWTRLWEIVVLGHYLRRADAPALRA